jgi:hypothetical protein
MKTCLLNELIRSKEKRNNYKSGKKKKKKKKYIKNETIIRLIIQAFTYW